MTTTIFTIKRDEDNYLYALVLTPKSRKPTEMRGWETVQDFREGIAEQYGPDAKYVSSREFQTEVEQRQVHTPAMIALLQQHSKEIEMDVTAYVVYGSAMRPMSAIWARIPDAVYVQVDKQITGYHTYVLVPEPLTAATVVHNELTFISRSEGK